ncbi:MAG: PorV/PorQ family protein [bacterium]|nr:PorV/PorQ family protein [bacterium]
MKTLQAAAILATVLLGVLPVMGQSKPYRVGTTTANFLEIGAESAGSAMGEAYVSVARDLSALYWNPAGLSFMNRNEIQFAYQPWIIDIQFSHAAAAFVLPSFGTFALSFTGMSYGNTPVTTLEMQEGTGETFSAMDIAASLSYARKLAQWFGFGATFKYVTSGIWHMRANAAALDMGLLINTGFFSPDEARENGLAIGMSISNYGTKMRFDGMDLLQPIDISEDEGNYKDVEGQFRLQSWELPLIFRVGASMLPFKTTHHQLCVAADALHANNNSESVNVGGEYRILIPGRVALCLRSGYRGLFMDRSEYGWTYGGGIHWALMNNRALKIDYALKSTGILGDYSMFTVGASF